jgi:hypothetical protein
MCDKKNMMWLVVALLVIVIVVKMCDKNENLAYEQLPQGSYIRSCNKCKINNNQLNCSCKKWDGSYVNTKYDLRNTCDNITNHNGELKCKTKNSYKTTCKNCKINNNQLNCSCRNEDGSYVNTKYDLRNKCDNIINCNGVLECNECSLK